MHLLAFSRDEVQLTSQGICLISEPSGCSCCPSAGFSGSSGPHQIWSDSSLPLLTAPTLSLAFYSFSSLCLRLAKVSFICYGCLGLCCFLQLLSGATFSLWCAKPLIVVVFSCRARGQYSHGCPAACGSSWSRDWTPCPPLSRQILTTASGKPVLGPRPFKLPYLFVIL